MNKRINIALPEETIKVLDRVAKKGSRSGFIAEAIDLYVNSKSQKNLKLLLKEEALANYGRDLAMAAEWFPLEEGG